MTLKVSVLIITLFSHSTLFSQNPNKELVVQLQLKRDNSGFGKFNYIMPNENTDSSKVPKNLLKVYTLSRFLTLKSVNINIPVLIGIAKNGYPVIIFDKNQNNDFTDDSVIYFYDTLKTSLEGNYKTISINLPNNLEETFDYTIIRPASFSINTGNAFENNFFFAIRPWEYRVGGFEMNNKKMYVYFLTKILYHFDRMWSDVVITTKTPDNLNFNEFIKAQKKYKIGDKIDVDDNKMVIKGISSTGTELRFEILTEDNGVGINVGFSAPLFNAVSLANRPIDLQSQRGHYVLLDYWGTWCGPCKMVLPGLKAMAHRFKNLKMIGVALDNDINQVRKFVAHDSISWEQVFVNKNEVDSNSICAKYNVENYPTFIVINPVGKIVFRDMGLDGFDRLIHYINVIDPKEE